LSDKRCQKPDLIYPQANRCQAEIMDATGEFNLTDNRSAGIFYQEMAYVSSGV
jgi:hypothetical protein